jgi:carboxymethylenebutenolidase
VAKSDKLVEGEAMADDRKNLPTNDTHPSAVHPDLQASAVHPLAVHPSDITRRDFAVLLVGAGLAATATTRSAAAAGNENELIETDVEIKTPDGTCDAAFIRPKTGSHPGVLIWPDAFGLRPSMRALARRIASEGDGYSVLVPNPFYRVSKAPFTDASTFNFQNADDMAKLRPLMASVTAPGNAEKDAAAYIAFLDAQKEVNKAKKIGTQGYCMGGPLVVRTAASVPDRIGAGASFHGGGLVTDKPDSPHLLAPKIKARMYFGIASNDDAKQPDAKDKLKEAFATAKILAEIEVYAALHGWCVPDMPVRDGVPIYNKPEAERAWGKLVALYRAALA